ncbi:MAG: WbqC family protein [Bacteroidetes bacterium]|nr:WbqC family protein [Bacteroidota bacterium]
MPGTILLSAFYFGTVEHYALIAAGHGVVIDAGEHYERQSYRSRTSLPGPNGRQDLNVCIARRSGEKMPMHTVGLSYAEPWNHRHLQAIRSTYGQTPWFIHFIDELEALLGQRHEGLVDLDLATLRLTLKWLGLHVPVEVRREHVEDASGLLDLRRSLHPKEPLPANVPAVGPYPQVFADRHGFMGRMCILDLLMNTGPQAGAILKGVTG